MFDIFSFFCRLLGRESSLNICQIDFDIRRTFRHHVMFRERYSPSQTDLFQILMAHSVYNTQVSRYFDPQVAWIFPKFYEKYHYKHPPNHKTSSQVS